MICCATSCGGTSAMEGGRFPPELLCLSFELVQTRSCRQGDEARRGLLVQLIGGILLGGQVLRQPGRNLEEQSQGAGADDRWVEPGVAVLGISCRDRVQVDGPIIRQKKITRLSKNFALARWRVPVEESHSCFCALIIFRS